MFYPNTVSTKFHLLKASAIMAIASATVPMAALAQDAATDNPAALIAELQEKLRLQDERLARLERMLKDATNVPAKLATSDRDTSPVDVAEATVADTRPAAPTGNLNISGDMRLRYEHNSSDGDERDDARGVVRGRIAATYAASPTLELGARLVTGDPDDPNSTDVSLSNFNDDLEVSLDQVYGIKTFGKLSVLGGKFANPFRRTDLVWDGDVNPQGLAARYAALDNGSTRIGGSALFFPIERSTAAQDSTASGFQLTLDQKASEAWEFGFAAGYYDYEIEAVGTADSGDTRTNLLDGSGTYLSDFDLLNIMTEASFSGFGDRWPLEIKAEYVRNLGADDYDTGYSVSASLGQASAPGTYSFGYGYHVAEADSVFAAFAQDNIPYASNYLQHTYSFSYALSEHLQMNTSLYAYRLKDEILIPFATDDWQQRLRVNLVANF